MKEEKQNAGERLMDGITEIRENLILDADEYSQSGDRVSDPNNSSSVEKRLESTAKNGKKIKLWIPAVCLVAAATAVLIAGLFLGWFKIEYKVTLDNGDTVVFRNNESAFGSFSLSFEEDTKSCMLTAEEISRLYPDNFQSTEVSAVFDANTGKMLHTENHNPNPSGDDSTPAIGAIHFDVDPSRLTDTPIGTNETTSMINGVPVTTCYCFTDSGRSSGKRILVSAAFPVGSVYAYVAGGGDAMEAETVCRLVAETTQKLIEKGDTAFLGMDRSEVFTIQYELNGLDDAILLEAQMEARKCEQVFIRIKTIKEGELHVLVDGEEAQMKQEGAGFKGFYFVMPEKDVLVSIKP